MEEAEENAQMLVDAPMGSVGLFCWLRGQISRLLVYRQGGGRESPIVRFWCVFSSSALGWRDCEPILPCGLCVAWTRGWG